MRLGWVSLARKGSSSEIRTVSEADLERSANCASVVTAHCQSTDEISILHSKHS